MHESIIIRVKLRFSAISVWSTSRMKMKMGGKRRGRRRIVSDRDRNRERCRRREGDEEYAINSDKFGRLNRNERVLLDICAALALTRSLWLFYPLSDNKANSISNKSTVWFCMRSFLSLSLSISIFFFCFKLPPVLIDFHFRWNVSVMLRSVLREFPIWQAACLDFIWYVRFDAWLSCAIRTVIGEWWTRRNVWLRSQPLVALGTSEIKRIGGASLKLVFHLSAHLHGVSSIPIRVFVCQRSCVWTLNVLSRSWGVCVCVCVASISVFIYARHKRMHRPCSHREMFTTLGMTPCVCDEHFNFRWKQKRVMKTNENKRWGVVYRTSLFTSIRNTLMDSKQETAPALWWRSFIACAVRLYEPNVYESSVYVVDVYSFRVSSIVWP